MLDGYSLVIQPLSLTLCRSHFPLKIHPRPTPSPMMAPQPSLSHSLSTLGLTRLLYCRPQRTARLGHAPLYFRLWKVRGHSALPAQVLLVGRPGFWPVIP
jgi:hypothetical protein